MTTPKSLSPEQIERAVRFADGLLSEAEAASLAGDLGESGALELERGRKLRELLTAVPEALETTSPGDLAFERIRRNVLAATVEAGSPSIGVRPATRKTAPSPIRAIYGSLVAAAAAAAVALVAFGPGATPGGEGTPRPRVSGTEIVHVEFGKASGTYWEQAEGEDRVAIVWIDDTVLDEVATP